MLDTATMEAIERWLYVRAEQSSSEDTKVLIHSLNQELRERRHQIEATGLLPLVNTPQRKVYKCPLCESKKSVYRIHFSKLHVSILKKIFVHCVEQKTHIIKKSDIKTLTHGDYTNFPVLQRFGFLYWLTDEEGNRTRKNKLWGVAVGRIASFLKGEYAVAEYSEKDTATKRQKTSENRIKISQVNRYSDEMYNMDKEFLLPYFVTYAIDENDKRAADRQ